MSFPKEIRMLRERLYLTQSEFAKALKVSFTTVNRWETGKARPNISTMREVKKFCEGNRVDYSLVEEAWLRMNVAANE